MISQLPIATARFLLTSLLSEKSAKEEELLMLRERIATLESQMFRLNDQLLSRPTVFSTGLSESPLNSQFPEHIQSHKHVLPCENPSFAENSHGTLPSEDGIPPPPPPPAPLLDGPSNPLETLARSLAKNKQRPAIPKNTPGPSGGPMVTADMLSNIRLKKVSETGFVSPKPRSNSVMNGQHLVSLDQLSSIKLRATPKQRRSPLRATIFNGRPVITSKDISSVQLKATPTKKTPEKNHSKQTLDQPKNTPDHPTQSHQLKTPRRSPLRIISRNSQDHLTPLYPRVSFKNNTKKSPKTPENAPISVKTPKTAPPKSRLSLVSKQSSFSRGSPLAVRGYAHICEDKENL